jgi:MerR family copper efflux transcriptional regulator
MTAERRMGVVRAQIGKLDAKVSELRSMADYLRAKLDWMAGGERGAEPEPTFARSVSGSPPLA